MRHLNPVFSSPAVPRGRPLLLLNGLERPAFLVLRLRLAYLLSLNSEPASEYPPLTEKRYPAATYSSTPLPGQYHRRRWA